MTLIPMDILMSCLKGTVGGFSPLVYKKKKEKGEEGRRRRSFGFFPLFRAQQSSVKLTSLPLPIRDRWV